MAQLAPNILHFKLIPNLWHEHKTEILAEFVILNTDDTLLKFIIHEIEKFRLHKTSTGQNAQQIQLFLGDLSRGICICNIENEQP